MNVQINIIVIHHIKFAVNNVQLKECGKIQLLIIAQNNVQIQIIIRIQILKCAFNFVKVHNFIKTISVKIVTILV